MEAPDELNIPKQGPLDNRFEKSPSTYTVCRDFETNVEKVGDPTDSSVWETAESPCSPEEHVKTSEPLQWQDNNSVFKLAPHDRVLGAYDTAALHLYNRPIMRAIFRHGRDSDSCATQDENPFNKLDTTMHRGVYPLPSVSVKAQVIIVDDSETELSARAAESEYSVQVSSLILAAPTMLMDGRRYQDESQSRTDASSPDDDVASLNWEASEPTTPTSEDAISEMDIPQALSSLPHARGPLRGTGFFAFGKSAGPLPSGYIVSEATPVEDFQSKPAKCRLQEEASHTVGLSASSENDQSWLPSTIRGDKMHIRDGSELCTLRKGENVAVDATSLVSLKFNIL